MDKFITFKGYQINCGEQETIFIEFKLHAIDKKYEHTVMGITPQANNLGGMPQSQSMCISFNARRCSHNECSLHRNETQTFSMSKSLTTAMLQRVPCLTSNLS